MLKNKKIIINFSLLLIVSLFFTSFSSAQSNDFSYNRLDFGNEVVDGLNYTINVNNTDHFQGYTVSSLWSYYTGLGNALWCQLTGCTMTGDISFTNKGLTNTEYISFDLTNTQTPAEGKMYWNDNDGTFNIGMKGGNVNLQVGQEMILRVKNDQGVQINNGEVVYVSNATGNNILVKLADADLITAHQTIGIATENIVAGQHGYITLIGMVREINTTGFTEGQPIYLSQTAGKYTHTIPPAPAHTVRLGYITKTSGTVGELFANIQIGADLSNLDDVLITTPLNNQVLVYNSTSGLWTNQNITDDDSAYLFINGTRSMTGNLNMGTKNITNTSYLCNTTGSCFTLTQLNASTPAPDLSPYWLRNGSSTATGNWDLGVYNFTANSLTSDTTFSAGGGNFLWHNYVQDALIPNGYAGLYFKGVDDTSVQLTLSDASGENLFQVYTYNDGSQVWDVFGGLKSDLEGFVPIWFETNKLWLNGYGLNIEPQLLIGNGYAPSGNPVTDESLGVYGKTILQGESYFGSYDTNNYTMIEADGTVMFTGTATVFNDVVVPIQTAQMGTHAMTWDTNEKTYYMDDAVSAITEDCFDFAIQTPHWQKLNTNAELHLHAYQISTSTSNYTLRTNYTIYGINQANTTWITSTKNFTPSSVSHNNTIYPLVSIPTTNKGISATIKGEICRVNGDASTQNLYIDFLDAHFEQDTIGSRSDYTK